MKSNNIVILATILLWNCSSNKTGENHLGNNPEYSEEVEVRIERVINNLQVETAIEGKFENKKLHDQMNNYHTPGVSIAVINNGEIEWSRGFGKPNMS